MLAWDLQKHIFPVSANWAMRRSERWKKQIEKTTGKKVRARYALDSSLLGGAVVRVGSTIYDGSVKGQLEKIRVAISS